MPRTFHSLLLFHLRSLLASVEVRGRSVPCSLLGIMVDVICSAKVIFTPFPPSR
jgi:hypothetical protein